MQRGRQETNRLKGFGKVLRTRQKKLIHGLITSKESQRKDGGGWVSLCPNFGRVIRSSKQLADEVLIKS